MVAVPVKDVSGVEVIARPAVVDEDGSGIDDADILARRANREVEKEGPVDCYYSRVGQCLATLFGSIPAAWMDWSRNQLRRHHIRRATLCSRRPAERPPLFLEKKFGSECYIDG